MSQETHDQTQDDGSVTNSDALNEAPKITLKSGARGAARIKKPPFGGAARSLIQTSPDGTPQFEVPNAGAMLDADETRFERWWRESGAVMAGGLILSAVWTLGFTIYITAAIGWGQLYALLPDQFGSFMATFMLPLAFLWLAIAYIDRGRELRRESAALRHHLALLTYPASHAEGQIATISESLKAQTRMLVEASDAAVKNMQKLQTGFLRDTEKLASVTGQLEAGAASAAGAVTDQVAKLQSVIDSAADVNLKIEDALRRQHEFVRTASQKTLSEVTNMGQSLAGHVNTLSSATERARGMSAAIAQQRGEQEKHWRRLAKQPSPMPMKWARPLPRIPNRLKTRSSAPRSRFPTWPTASWAKPIISKPCLISSVQNSPPPVTASKIRPPRSRCVWVSRPPISIRSWNACSAA